MVVEQEATDPRKAAVEAAIARAKARKAAQQPQPATEEAPVDPRKAAVEAAIARAKARKAAQQPQPAAEEAPVDPRKAAVEAAIARAKARKAAQQEVQQPAANDDPRSRRRRRDCTRSGEESRTASS